MCSGIDRGSAAQTMPVRIRRIAGGGGSNAIGGGGFTETAIDSGIADIPLSF